MASTMEQQPVRTRRSFTDEFRRDAVAMVLDDGNKIVDVARRLGVGEGTLGNWVRQERTDRGERAGLSSTLGAMTTVEIPTEAARRLQAEADRRGITVDELVVELAAGLPPAAPAGRRRKLAFAGVAASGGHKPAGGADRWLAEGFGRD